MKMFDNPFLVASILGGTKVPWKFQVSIAIIYFRLCLDQSVRQSIYFRTTILNINVINTKNFNLFLNNGHR